MSIVINGTGSITGINAGGLPDGVITQPDLASGVAGNGPAFSAFLGANQSTSNDVLTKVQINTEWFDTNNCYNTTTHRFTPNVAGYYQVNTIVRAVANNNYLALYTWIYKNGSIYTRVGEYNFNMNASNHHANGSILIYLNGSTDYIELYALTYSSVGTGNTFSATPTAGTGENACQFSAYLARAA